MTLYEQKEPVAYMAIFPAQFNRDDSRLFYLSRNIESVNKIWVNSQVDLNYGWSMETEGWGRAEQRLNPQLLAREAEPYVSFWIQRTFLC